MQKEGIARQVKRSFDRMRWENSNGEFHACYYKYIKPLSCIWFYYDMAMSGGVTIRFKGDDFGLVKSEQVTVNSLDEAMAYTIDKIEMIYRQIEAKQNLFWKIDEEVENYRQRKMAEMFKSVMEEA